MNEYLDSAAAETEEHAEIPQNTAITQLKALIVSLKDAEITIDAIKAMLDAKVAPPKSRRKILLRSADITNELIIVCFRDADFWSKCSWTKKMAVAKSMGLTDELFDIAAGKFMLIESMKPLCRKAQTNPDAKTSPTCNNFQALCAAIRTKISGDDVNANIIAQKMIALRQDEVDQATKVTKLSRTDIRDTYSQVRQ